MARWTSILLLGVLCCGGAAGQECVDYSALPVARDALVDDLQILVIATDGARLCYATSRSDGSGLRLVWTVVSPEGNPMILGEYESPVGEVTLLDIDGDLAAVGYRSGTDTGGWLLVDFTDPAAPVQQADLVTDHPVRGIAVSDSLLVASVDYLGVGVYDLGDPQAPERVAELLDGLSGYTVVESDGRWYVSNYSGIQIYDLATPEAPVQLGSTEGFTSDWSLPFTVRNGWIAARTTRWVFVDADPNGPEYSYWIYTKSLVVLDASQPDSIREIGSIYFGDRSVGSPIMGDGEVFLSLDNSLVQYSAINGEWGLTYGIASARGVQSAVLCEDRVYYAEDARLYTITSVTSAGSPVVGWLKPGAVAVDLEVTDTHAFISRQSDADVSKIQNPYRVAIYDLTEPSMPVRIGTATGAWSHPPNDFVVHDEYLYTDTGIVHWPTDTHPEQQLYLRHDGVVLDETLYGIIDTHGFHVYDLSDPGQPESVGVYGEEQSFSTLVQGGDDLFVCSSGVLNSYDVTDARVPVLGGASPLAMPVDRGVSDGEYLYMVGAAGLSIHSLADPSQPVFVASYEQADCHDVACSGNILYIAAGPKGLLVLDVTEPTAPALRGSIYAGSDAQRVVVSHGLVYFLSKKDFLILRPDCLGMVPITNPWTPETPISVFETALAVPTPNPFNPNTELSFTMERPGRVELTIHDAAGRRIRTLVDEARAMGPHTVQWDGRDATGRAAPAGVYFARFEADGRVETRKLALVK